MATPTQTGTVAPGGKANDVFPPFDTNQYGSQLLWLAIAFGLLYYLMAKVALPRVADILETRRDRIESDLDEARGLKSEAEAARLGYDKALADAKANASKLAQSARDEAQAELDQGKALADAADQKRIAASEALISTARAKALAELDGIATDTAIAVVERLGGKPDRKALAAAISDMK